MHALYVLVAIFLILGALVRLPPLKGKLAEIGDKHRQKKHNVWVNQMKEKHGKKWIYYV